MAGNRGWRRKKAARLDDLFDDTPDRGQEPAGEGAATDGSSPDVSSTDVRPTDVPPTDVSPPDGSSPEELPPERAVPPERSSRDAHAGPTADTAAEEPRRRGRARWATAAPWLRAVGVAAVAGGLVYGAGLPGVAPVDAEQALDLPSAAEVTPVQEAGLSLVTDRLVVCPGPELIGLDDPTVTEPEQVVQVWGTSAPREALPEEVPEQALAAPGTVLVERSDDTVREDSERGATVRVMAREDQWAQVRGAGSLAAGTVGGQVHLGLEEQQRGLSTAPCGPAQEESWLVAGADQPGRVERLVLVNPTGNPVTADVEILGADGPVEVAGGRGVVVPAGGRHVVLLDALAPGEARPVVHVQTSGGPLVSTIGDRWLEGTVDRGLELVTPTAAPATEAVIPAVSAPRADSADTATVRVAVPGAEAAVVQLRALTAEGPLRVEQDVVTVPAGSVADIDVADLPEGTQGLEIVADVPVVAAAHIERRDDDEGPGDLAWVPAATPTEGLQGAVLARQPAEEPEPEYSRVLSVASTTGATASVTTVRGDQVSTEELVVPAAGAATLQLDHAVDSVWVRPTEGAVSAGVVTEVSEVSEGGGPLVAGMVLSQVPLTEQVRSVIPWTP